MLIALKRHLILAAALALTLALTGARSAHAPAQAPAGQPALVTLDEAAYAQLKERFNAAGATTRVVALLSPT